MGVFDKIKNALFEEEYVEIEEKPKKPKKSKIKEKKNKEEETPIAKKVVLPEKKEFMFSLEISILLTKMNVSVMIWWQSCFSVKIFVFFKFSDM